jgi:glycerophosphoryl diester phosphodiesterase
MTLQTNFFRPIFLGIMLISILESCFLRSPKNVKIPTNFDWQGHRGCRGLLPENTVAAFVHALDFSEIQTLECDVVLTADRKILISHEPFPNPDICLKPNGDSISKKLAMTFSFFKMNLAEIQQFDCGSIGNPRFPDQKRQKTAKPTLREAAEATRKAHPNRVFFWNIEIKSDSAGYGTFCALPEESVRLVLAEIRALGLENLATIQSFDPEVLRELKKQGTTAKLAFLVENKQSLETNLGKIGFTPNIYSPYHLFLTRRFIKKCHEKGMKVIPWTVNETGRMRALIAIGVDGIITDYPNRIPK